MERRMSDKLPIVAIVGRPNVGKSSLFNRLVGGRRAIVKEEPGITRDRIYGVCRWLGSAFTVVDTGGLVPWGEGALLEAVYSQVATAIDEADVVVFLVDAREGVTPTDLELAQRLRSCGKPLILVANKVDIWDKRDVALPFYELGLGEPLPISATAAVNVDALLEKLAAMLPESPPEEEGGKPIPVAILGRPNAGKSSILNALAGRERVIVDERPGTTRDAIDVDMVFGDLALRFVDTAGLRRPSRIDTKLEAYTISRALAAGRRCHVCLLILDAGAGVASQDARIARFITEEARACIIVVNKWDLIRKLGGSEATLRSDFERMIRDKLPHLSYCPVAFISAKTGLGVADLPAAIGEVHGWYARRIPTGQLQRVVGEEIDVIARGGKRLRLYHVTQASVAPPSIVAFVNNPDAVDDSFKRMLVNRVRKVYPFTGSPIRVFVRGKR